MAWLTVNCNKVAPANFGPANLLKIDSTQVFTREYYKFFGDVMYQFLGMRNIDSTGIGESS